MLFRRRTILFDVRETETLRGYHALAVAGMAADRLRKYRLAALVRPHPEEILAVEALCFETRLRIRLQEAETEPPAAPDLVVMIAEALPEDGVSIALRSGKGHVLLGLTLRPDGAAPPTANVTVVDGMDTRALAELVCAKAASLG